MGLRGPIPAQHVWGNAVSGNPLTPGRSLRRGFDLRTQLQECWENQKGEGEATSR